MVLAFAIFAMGFWGVGKSTVTFFRTLAVQVSELEAMSATWDEVLVSSSIMAVTGLLSTFNGLLIGLGAVFGKKPT
jgi:hypothetical protein